MLPQPIYIELPPREGRGHASILQPSSLSIRLQNPRPIHIKLHRLLSQVRSLNPQPSNDNAWLTITNSGWDGLATASNAPSYRPAYSGTCYTNIYNVPIKVTVYNDASILASSLFTATNSLAQAYAYPYEGFAFGVAEVASTTASTTATASTASSTPVPAPAQLSSSSVTASSSSGLSGGAIAGIVIGAVAGVALLALALFALLRYRRRRLAGPEVPPYEPDMQYQAPDPSTVPASGANGVDTVGSDDMGGDKKPNQPEIASEMEAKNIVQEMPEEPHRWHELESPPATT